MAEALAAIGIIANIVEVVEFGFQIVSRLNEFQCSVNETPKSFRQIKTELPLLLYTLKETEKTIASGSVSEEAARALVPVVLGCREQVESLDSVLQKALPAPGDSRGKRHLKALSTLFQDGRIEEISLSLSKYVQTLTFYHVATTSTMQPSTEEKLSKLRHWLSAPDPFQIHQKALQERLKDTGQWFLRSEQYSKWKAGLTSFLWLHGIPGSGKSILCSAIIEDILQESYNDPGKATAYYYFTFSDSRHQVPELMVRSLIVQFSKQCRQIPEGLLPLLSSNLDRRPSPRLDELLEVLHQMIQHFPAPSIVLDALDESTGQTQLLRILKTMAKWDVRIIVTSRDEQDIRSSLEDLVGENNAICLQSRLVNEDIAIYIRHRLYTDKSLKRWQKDLQVRQEIETQLMEKAHGMFRWAACQLDALAKCLNRSMLRKSLKSLPRTLDETYERILCAIDDDYREYALRILQWLAFSAMPLYVGQVAEVVAISVDGSPMFDRDQVLEDPLDVLRICPSLVTVVSTPIVGPVPRELAEKGIFYEQDDIFTLAHYSVKEYLLSKRIQQGPAAAYSIEERTTNKFLANSCLAYLLQFREPDCINDDTRKKSKLTMYAAEFWVQHARAAEPDTELTYQLIMELLSPTSNAFYNWVRIRDYDRPSLSGTLCLDDIPTPLYYALVAGLPKIARLLVEKTSVDVNARGGLYGSALQAASYHGHIEMVEKLLEMGADFDMQGGLYGTALQAACVSGCDKVVMQLLEVGADVNAQSGYYGNALQAAAAYGSTKIVKRLIEAGADVKMQGGYWGSALHAASAYSHCEVIRQLLGAGADINMQSEQHGSVLQAAACYALEESPVEQPTSFCLPSKKHDNTPQAAAEHSGHDVIKQLLAAGADVNAQGGEFGTALQAASAKGYDEVVKQLLQAGANVNDTKSGHYGSALQAASAWGHLKIIKLLLEAGADINAQDGGYFGSALQAACYNRHDTVVKFFLEAGAEVNVQGGEYGTALQAACASGHGTVVKLLLEKGADINMRGGRYSSALQAACSRGHDIVLKQLLEAGADVNVQGGEYGTALQAACACGSDEMTRLLLGAGADPNIQGGRHNTALQVACIYGHDILVKLLLEAGADANAQTEGYYGSALQATCAYGHDAIAELLLDAGADVNARGGEYSTALQAASAEVNERVSLVKRLLEVGADVNPPQGGRHGSALQAACYRGHEAVVKLLLDAGADVNAQGGGEYGNALQAAKANGFENIVRLLLEAGANAGELVDINNKVNGSAPILASVNA